MRGNIPISEPIVVERKGTLVANSRDVAAYFKKEHKNVLRDIDNILKNMQSSNLSSLYFTKMPYTVEGQAREYLSYDMTKNAFMLLVMGFTGSEALSFKLRYIEQFDAMETALRDQTILHKTGGYYIPPDYASALRLAADKEKELQIVTTNLAKAQPKADAYRDMLDKDGTVNISVAAKIIQIKCKDLVDQMQRDGWLCKRSKKSNVATEWAREKGFLRQIVGTSSERYIYSQAVVTSTGLSALYFASHGQQLFFHKVDPAHLLPAPEVVQ